MPKSILANPQPKSSVQEQQAEAEALFTSIGDGAITTDEFGKITRVNPAAERLLGYSEADLIGEWMPKKIVAVTADDQPINLIDRPITQVFLTGRPITDKIHYRKKDGQIVALAVNASPITLNGRPLGAIEVFRDITFEQEVDRMKDEFISLASHQLRTPLSAIKTYSHMLADGYMGEMNAAQRSALNTVINASDRMNELISTLLNVTRIESGSIIVKPKTIHISQIVKEVIKEIGLMADEKAIDLSIVCEGNTKVRSDVLIIKEIVTNLVTNAIKYTPRMGTVCVTVKPEPRHVTIQVNDSGWGIPANLKDQVFTKFFRAQNVVNRETRGTGLGLYLVKGLTDTLGGDVWFDSQENGGTTFFFRLPRAYDKLPTKAPKRKVNRRSGARV